MKYILASLILIVTSCQTGFNRKIKNTNNELLGQSAPPDMIFIQGNDSTPSYYMPVCEETNVNYMIYLLWLNQTFGADYPLMVLEALPHKNDGSNVTGLDDPFITNYFSNPLYAYYPVVNLDFQQIEKYLSWKTDRLNEAILIKNKILKINFNQVNEDNFVFEAYLSGQYEGLVMNELIDLNPNNEYYKPGLNTGMFFTGYRLPTKKEWNFANQEKFKNKNKERVKSPYSNKHGFGKHYFLYQYFKLEWGGLGNVGYNGRHQFQPGIQQYTFPISSYEKTSFEYPMPDSGYASIMNYASNSYGLINMEGGVQERLIDAENLTSEQEQNWVNTLKASGYTNIPKIITNIGGYELEKNQYGKMKYRYFGINEDGTGNKFVPPTKNINRLVKTGSYDAPSNKESIINDTTFQSNVGFRCVLPYVGAPVLKGYKVKWK